MPTERSLMMAFIQIDNDVLRQDVQRIKNTLQQLKCDIGEITAEKLLTFFSTALKNNGFEEDKYLELCRSTIQSTIHSIQEREIRQFWLDLSRIHCAVGQLYLDFNILEYMAETAAHNPNDYSDNNKIVITDLVYQHFLQKALQLYKNFGYSQFVIFLKNNEYLNTESAAIIRGQILHHFFNNLVIKNKKEILLFKNDFGDEPSLVKKMKQLDI